MKIYNVNVKINCNINIIVILTIITFLNSLSFNLVKKNLKKIQKSKIDLSKEITTIDKSKLTVSINDSIQFKCWVKYLHYDGHDLQKPKAFYRNTQYEIQQKISSIKDPPLLDKTSADYQPSKESDRITYRIPSELHFFAIVYKDSINFFNSREHNEGFSNVIDSLNFENIDPIPESDTKNGGVRDYGKFNEGYCLRINTKMPTTFFLQTKENLEPKESEYQTKKWIICADQLETKNTLMKMLIKLKLDLQHSKDIYLEYAKSDPLIDSQKKDGGLIVSPSNGKAGDIFEAAQQPNDCYMIIIHPWSPCTLACGGGKSYQQLMKIEAKSGGRDCKTKNTILERDCNKQACPTVIEMKNLPGIFNNYEKKKYEQSPEFYNATMKIMAISKRPQRYDKCHLKESDALMEKKDESTKNFSSYPLIPVRIVMNDKTLTAFLDENLSNKIVTYLLDESIIIRKDDKKCFIIENNIREDKFCILDSRNNEFVEEWYYDFNLFKHQCKKEREKSLINIKEEKKFEDEFKHKVEDLKLELVKEKTENMKKLIEKTEKKKLTNKIQEIRKVSLTAIEKEMRLENLLEKEEASREESEYQVLEQKIAQEKKKEECLLKAIKEKELENQYNLAKAQAEHAIQQITKATQQQIIEQRQRIARKIIEMRQKKKRRVAELNSKFLTIKMKITEKLQEINKTGDDCVCRDFKNKDSYCNKNFPDNYIKFQDCSKKESFCYTCCENEFGELHIIERDNCYSKCGEVSEI